MLHLYWNYENARTYATLTTNRLSIHMRLFCVQKLALIISFSLRLSLHLQYSEVLAITKYSYCHGCLLTLVHLSKQQNIFYFSNETMHPAQTDPIQRRPISKCNYRNEPKQKKNKITWFWPSVIMSMINCVIEWNNNKLMISHACASIIPYLRCITRVSILIFDISEYHMV